jgi:endoglucanase
MFGFGTWDQATKPFPVGPEGIHLVAANGQGGAGVAGLSIDLSAYADWTPALNLTAGDANQATGLNLQLGDVAGARYSYRFDLRGLKPGARTPVLADYGASLSEPQTIDKAGPTPGFGRLAVWLLIGDWSGNRVDLVLGGVGLAPPTDELRAGRARLRELHAKEAERARAEAEAAERARQALLTKGASHRPDDPEVRLVCATAPDVLSFQLQAGHQVNNELQPYVAQPGDELVAEAKDKPRHAVRDGRVVDYYQTAVYRRIDGRRTRLGLLSPDHTQLFIEHGSRGQPLDETVVDLPAAYRLQSPDDPAYAAPTQPLAVWRKGKPDGYSQPLPFLYTISLKLPSPLKIGASYTIRLLGVNSAQETVTYVHQPRSARSLAIHAIQTGYRPDDPYKRAYVSFWMGVDKDGHAGSCTPAVTTFELLDTAGGTVFTGQAQLAKAEGAEEQICIHEKFDYTRAAVYRLDFSAFERPGEYRVHVPGLGVSGPFKLAADVWEAPFRAAMQGILSQRQGIDLGPPYTAFTRKRAYHPDDGVEFYQLDIPHQAGEEGVRGARLIELAKAGPLPRTTIVAGGYQDAGDWDTAGHHLGASYDLLGLYDLNPAAFARFKLALPPAELANGLPAILNEALWQMPMWRSLQLPDGGVRGGYGYGWECYPGETSSMQRDAGVYVPDPDTTLRWAATAARAARVLAAFDKGHAAEYLDSAKRAWAWAAVHAKPDDPNYRLAQKYDPNLAGGLRQWRAAAAVELLAATGDAAYDQAFHQSTELTDAKALYLDQPAADFAYARLPAGLGDAALKAAAVARFAKYADHALAFSHRNAFDILAGHRTDMPMIFVSRFFSTPGAGGLNLIYAYELTKKPEYLAAAVQGANYSLGANADNFSYCCGVGANAERYPFFVDAQVSGQYPDVPVGHIPYGQGNEGNAMSRGANGWVQTWLLNYGPTKKMTPNWFDWPVNEQYIDFGHYPLNNETCFDATTVPAACYWFWLATRS